MPRITDSEQVDTVPTTPLSRVTQRSRILGTRRELVERPRVVSPGFALDWGAVVSSVCIGLAITAMLAILGVATGLIAANEGTDAGEAGGILGSIGAWTVISMLIGSFVGSFVGGRLTSWLDRMSLAGHVATSWGIATLLAIALAALVSIGFAGTASSAATTAVAADQATQEGTTADNEGGQTAENAQTTEEGATQQGEQTADDTGDALGGAGWGLGLGMLLSLVAAAAGWFLGARKPLTDIEREEADEVVAT